MRRDAPTRRRRTHLSAPQSARCRAPHGPESMCRPMGCSSQYDQGRRIAARPPTAQNRNHRSSAPAASMAEGEAAWTSTTMAEAAAVGASDNSRIRSAFIRSRTDPSVARPSGTPHLCAPTSQLLFVGLSSTSACIDEKSWHGQTLGCVLQVRQQHWNGNGKKSRAVGHSGCGVIHDRAYTTRDAFEIGRGQPATTGTLATNHCSPNDTTSTP